MLVMAWVAWVFFVPRSLVNLAEAGEAGEPEAVRARLLLMGTRLYKFGHTMFGLAFVAGVLLWQGFRMWPQYFPNIVAGMGWLHAKLALVAVMLAFFVYCGRVLKSVAKGAPVGSSKRWRLWNELPIALLFGIIFLVLAKPF
jgi:putative membrane protein